MRQKLYDKNGSEFEVWLSGFAFDGERQRSYHPVGVLVDRTGPVNYKFT